MILENKPAKFTLKDAAWIIDKRTKTRPLAIRNVFGYTQEYVAECMGVNQTTYSRWEKGYMPFSIERIEKLAKIYGLTFDSFFGDFEQIEILAEKARWLKP